MEELIRDLLLACPLLRDASVVGRDGGYTAHVVPSAGPRGPDGPAAAARHVRDWGRVFDLRYRGLLGDRAGDPFAGWHSAYTGERLAEADMAEWRAASLQRIVDLRPCRVLELGCGTGLIATGLAGRCETYCGTDVSPTAISRLGERLGPARPGWRLRAQPAHDVTGLDAGFDTVVLNSVVQYFPSWDYLLEVLTRALELMPAGGHVFVGDVRNLALLEPYHTSLALTRFGPDEPAGSVRLWVEEQAGGESELLVHPAAFAALPRLLPGVTNVTVRPRRGRLRNEMTCFRYDVVIHVREAAPAPAELVRVVPDDRVEPFVQTWRALAAAPAGTPFGDVRRGAGGAATDPETVWGSAGGLDVHLAADHAPGEVAIVSLPRPAATWCAGGTPLLEPAGDRVARLASSPLDDRLRRQRRTLARRVEAYLAARLPAAAPAVDVVPVDRLPARSEGAA